MLVKTTVPARISLLKAVVESTGAFRRLLHTRGGYIYKIINSFHIYFYKVCNLFNNQLKFIFKIFSIICSLTYAEVHVHFVYLSVDLSELFN